MTKKLKDRNKSIFSFTNKKGYTLVELLVVSGILGILSPFLVNIFINMMTVTNYNIALNNQKKFDAVFVSKLSRVVNAGVKFIGRNPAQQPPTSTITSPSNMSEFYLSIIAPPNYQVANYSYSPLHINSRILPVLDPKGTFSPVNSSTTTSTNAFDGNNVGNSLMLFTIEDSLTYTYDNTGKYTSSSTAYKKRFPLYQLHYFYLAKANNDLFQNRNIKKGTLDKITNTNLLLLEWKSNYMLSYEDLTEFATTKLSGSSYGDISDLKSKIPNLKSDLEQNIPIDSVWNFSQANYTATNKLMKLSSISSTGTAPAITLTGTEYSSSDPLKTYVLSNVATYPQPDQIYYGIANNNFDLADKTASYNITENYRKAPFFEQIPINTYNNSTDGFPHGFEVMLSGSSGSTKTFIRMLSLAKGKSVTSYNQTQITLQGKN
ncbi:MAG: prepilin-type N-terminal cleavage/methylation domain-containing protein [Candidatus Sericytochromatia bacterium]